jgi:hypothetical protein
MWRGEAQGLLDLLMMPSRSSWSNSALAAANFSASRRRCPPGGGMAQEINADDGELHVS